MAKACAQTAARPEPFDDSQHQDSRVPEMLQQRGIPAKRLLAGTGLGPRALSAPGRMVEIEQHNAVVANLIRLAPEPDLAFTVGEAFDFADLGILGYALLSSRNMREAWGIWSQYSSGLFGAPLRFALRESGHVEWRLVIDSFVTQRELQRFYVEELLVIGLRLFGMLALRTPQIESIAFAYPEPRHRAAYERSFGPHLKFDAPQNVLSIRSPGLDAPIRTNDEELNLACSRQCRQILQQLSRSGDVEPRLRSLFLTSSSRLPDLGAASGQLGYSQRTLRRRLQNNGRGYRQLKHEFRLDLARQYLDSGHLAIKEVSHLLGYASPSVFCRAFRSWTGQTPGACLRTRAGP